MSATANIEETLRSAITILSSLDQFEACKDMAWDIGRSLPGLREMAETLRYVADFDGMALSQDQYAAVAKRAKRALTTNGLSL